MTGRITYLPRRRDVELGQQFGVYLVVSGVQFEGRGSSYTAAEADAVGKARAAMLADVKLIDRNVPLPRDINI